ncbi:inositol 2-dehydrogenase [Gracilibacillus thailandensis]|uniref:Inositol 2-dehydrogenase n=1 Tax=Gracilibacillus thailandensis TaxID=563735 RepID=A0A6N7R3A3_9BACI|nr:inositol 2-dehydrogenase [Gracilibacillus thailandensis]MRI67076.1 inositol 2-dehydrogenase [Gracilibacillus thailandensis]
MQKLKIGIIGVGRIGKIHAYNALHSNKFELRAISDVSNDQLDHSSLRESVPIITNQPEKILTDSEIDAIFICSSTDTHVDYIKKAASEGKHVFCEKPISLHIHDTYEVLDIVKKANIKFQVGFNRRYDKHFKKVYESVRKGVVGNPHIIKITSRDPKPPSEQYIKQSGGMFMDMTIHDFDLIRYLSGREVEEVSVKTANLISPIFHKNKDVDTAVITLIFDDGSLGVIDNSRQAVYGYDQRIEVFGEKGLIKVENEKETNLEVSTKDSVVVAQPSYFFLDRYYDAYQSEIDAFADSILLNKSTLTQLDDGLKAEILALTAKKSAQEERSVKVNEVCADYGLPYF